MNKKISILFISHSPFENGAELTLYNLISNLNRDKFAIHIAFPYYGPLVDRSRNVGFNTYILPMERWIRFDYDNPIKNSNLKDRLRLLSNIILDNNIDIIHSNTSVIIEGALAAAMTKKIHVWHFHEFLIGHPELNSLYPLHFVFDCVKRLSDRVITVSDYVKRQFIDLGVGSKGLQTIYNGIPKDDVIMRVNYFRDVYKLSIDDVIIINIGLLSETKGFMNFLKAANLAISKNRNLKFFWIGGNLKCSLKKFNDFIIKYGLSKNIYFLGHRTDVRNLIECSDIQICSSLLETFSLTILEAMSAKKPVVSTDCGGPAELIIDGKTGYLVPIDNYFMLSDRILELSNDPNKRNSFGLNGYLIYKEKFTLKKFIKNFENLYLHLMETSNEELIKVRLGIVNKILNEYENLSKENWKQIKPSKLRNLINRFNFS